MTSEGAMAACSSCLRPGPDFNGMISCDPVKKNEPRLLVGKRLEMKALICTVMCVSYSTLKWGGKEQKKTYTKEKKGRTG